MSSSEEAHATAREKVLETKSAVRSALYKLVDVAAARRATDAMVEDFLASVDRYAELAGEEQRAYMLIFSERKEQLDEPEKKGEE